MCSNSIAWNEETWQGLSIWSNIYVHRYTHFLTLRMFTGVCGLEHHIVNIVFCKLWAGTGMGAAAVFERGDSVDELCNARKGDNLFLSKDAR